MAEAHYLSDKDGKKFYPYAHASATYDNNGNTVENRLKALDKTTASAVQSVKIGTTEYKSGTTVTLPSYPTSLPASDVPSWAKQKTKPTYTASEVGLGNVGNFKAVSTVESQGLTDTEKSNARANIGAQVAGSYASSTHTHDDKYQAKGSYASASHTHDDRYYTESEIDSKLGGKANSSHTHTKSQITDFPTSMPASDVYSWAKASSKPSYTKSEVGLGNVDNTADANKSVKSSKRLETYKQGSTTETYGDNYPVYAQWRDSSHVKMKCDNYTVETDYATNAGNASTVNGHTVNANVPSGAKFTDTNTWRPLGTTADTACAGNDSRLSNARPASGGTATYANYVYATSHQGSWYQNSQWDGTYFQTNYKNGDNVLPMRVNNAGYADSAGSANSVAWGNVSGRPSSMPASDVYSWAKASSKPSYSWGEIGSKPSTFTPSSHTHNYAGSSSAGGSANSLSYFQNTSSTNVGQAEGGSNAIAYISDYSGTALTSGVKDGALYRQAYSTSWVHQIYGDYRTGQIAVRGKNNGAWQNWRRVLDESNYKTFCTPANIGAAAANHSHSNYLTGINKSMVVNALGYTPPTTDTNTWRGVQNNLTSTATDQSLSAYQGKVLRGMIHRVIVQSSEPTISTNDEWLLEY